MSVQTIEKPIIRNRLMPMFKVIMHNDPTTTMQFVVEVLIGIFQKSEQDAVRLMLEIHQTGEALVGVYPLEHAEMKVDQTHSLARARAFPLKCTIEPA